MMNARVVSVVGVVCLGFILGCGTDTIVVETPDVAAAGDRVHPKLVVTSPVSGTFATTPEVTIEGTLEVGSAPVELTINGDLVPVTDGAFAHTVTLRSGPNLIGLRADAEDRGRAVGAVTVYGPRVYEPGEMIYEAMLVHLGQAFLDNDTAELDDVAGILQALLQDDEFLESFFEEPYEIGEDSELWVEHVFLSDVSIDLEAGPACLTTEIILGDARGQGGTVEIDLLATGSGALLGELIMLRAERVRIAALICPEVGVQGLDFEILDPAVNFTGFALSTEEYPDLAEEMPAVNDALATIAESALASWIGNSLSDLLLELIADLATTYVFGEAPEITAQFSLEDAQVHSGGLVLEYGVRFSTPPGLEGLPAHIGSPRTIDPGLPLAFSDAPIAVALSDDALNQILFSSWYGGGVSAFEFPPEALEALPEIFQPITSFEIDLVVPPAFVLPREEEDFAYDLAVGALPMRILADQDRYFDMEIHFQAGVGVELDEEGLLAMAIDNRAQRILVLAAVHEAPEVHDPGDIAALLRMMVPSILGEMNVTMPGFPIPSLDLSLFSEGLSGFQGRELTLIPEGLRRGGDGGGYLIVEGGIGEVEITAD